MSRRLLVEADGGSRGNPGPAASGSVVIDPETNTVLAEIGRFLGVTTNNVAEYTGLREGLRRAWDIAPDAAIHVRMDSKLVVEQMSGRWKIKHPDMQRLAAEIRELIGARQVTYEWVARAFNKRADAVANRSMDAAADIDE